MTNTNFDSVKLAQELIRFASVSGADDGGVMDFLAQNLKQIGFECDILEFAGDGSYPVKNLHALYNPNNSNDIFYFAGHTDIVAAGDEKLWRCPPFAAEIIDGILYGRGAVDMKCAVAAFVCAAADYISNSKNKNQNSNSNFGIGFLITGDEEKDAINGTAKMLSWMKKNNKKISACLIGEPTNPRKLGEMAKIGRRGSINFNLKIIGKQGHVAYPENANNPITSLINILKLLKDLRLDEGNKFFDASNLEITSISSPNLGNNVIPSDASANFNIRFNDHYHAKDLVDMVKKLCSLAGGADEEYNLDYKISGESFVTAPGFLSDIVVAAIKDKTGLSPELSTSGGISDARFIKDFCPVIEFGLINQTAHHINECAAIADIYLLKEIYQKILEDYANR